MFHLRRNPICIGQGTVFGGKLIWRLKARPTLLSREYGIRIELQQRGTPSVFVETPNLSDLADGRSIPHVYGENPLQLCLYHPTYKEWSGDMRLDETIVLWSYLWLFYYEEWLTSNEWKGGGEHPTPGRPRRVDRQVVDRGYGRRR